MTFFVSYFYSMTFFVSYFYSPRGVKQDIANSRITIMKCFTIIDILEVSQILRIFLRKIGLCKIDFRSFTQMHFLFYSIFLFS